MGKFKIAGGLIGGLGAGTLAVGKNQMEVNRELANALRAEALQIKSFAHTESENTKTRELTASEGLANRTAKTKDLEKEIASKEKIASEIRDLKSELASASEEGKREKLKTEIMIKEGQLAVTQQLADMKVAYTQGLISVAQQNANTKEKQVDTGKTSSPTEQAKARKEAITEAQGYIDSGDAKTAQTLLSPFGLILQEETVPGQKNWILPNEKDTKKYHIVDAGQSGSAAAPTTGEAGTPQAGRVSPGKPLTPDEAKAEKLLKAAEARKGVKPTPDGSPATAPAVEASPLTVEEARAQEKIRHGEETAKQNEAVRGNIKKTIQGLIDYRKKAAQGVVDFGKSGGTAAIPARPTDKGYGLREDGTPKGSGWLGELKRPDGMVSTELSATVKIDGKEVLIPLLVPTLTKKEVDQLLSGSGYTDATIHKAIEFAKQRIAQGLSPFKD